MKMDRPLQLTDELRTRLKKPIGKLISGSEENLAHAVDVIKNELKKGKPELIVTVGDVVAKSFNEGDLPMDIAVVDYQVKRVETFKNLSEIGFAKKEPDAIAENPKGTLTPAAFSAVEKALLSLRGPRHGGRRGNPPFVIRVIGEEDLVTLAVILFAPLGTHVFYGQPNEGIVDVAVTQEKKAEIQDIIPQFTT